MAAIVMLHIRLDHCLLMHDKRNQDYWQSKLMIGISCRLSYPEHEWTTTFYCNRTKFNVNPVHWPIMTERFVIKSPQHN